MNVSTKESESARHSIATCGSQARYIRWQTPSLPCSGIVKNSQIAQNIVDKANLLPIDKVLEVGPGTEPYCNDS
ncbi:hypothetical protein DEU56DRAFT_834759 [Suillus clintonianus]|uniref:uncharacterized protein n=1 Tax=Suillus clintonianus TaxID=1904413 RepID=UPI001B87E9D5|nr:uncharacterized protein DEU56DRAFT_834759 [Suillus clintonianus]KAG2121223.1 hypothetical protein DEU56DRAFT_834759 [Suillus clintonianus]